jgi:hypothetical protein
MTNLTLTDYRPTEFNVLVRIERAQTMRGSLHLPDDKVERDQAMNIRGVLVSASPLAFSYDSWEGVPEDEKPQVGDRVIFEKGAGVYINDKESGDGEYYRILKDKSIAMRIPASVVVKQVKAA